ncbi:MAG: DUF1080 domain-containing protein [Bacteroidota bacterium]
MKSYSFYLLSCFICLLHCSGLCQPAGKNSVRLFDGKSFNGWEGDTMQTWHIQNGALTGGSFEETVAHNYFLATKESYSNFILKLKFKLVSKEGFMNAGVQFRSERLTDPAYEMTGYQADLGPGYWASLYDESRRNKTLASPDSLLIEKILKPGNWNDYEIRVNKNHIELFLNGTQTVSYTEKDNSIPQNGRIALQIHGGGKTVVMYKDIFIKKL